MVLGFHLTIFIIIHTFYILHLISVYKNVCKLRAILSKSHCQYIKKYNTTHHHNHILSIESACTIFGVITDFRKSLFY